MLPELHVAHSLLSHLACSWCDARHNADVVQNLCTSCGGPLFARYDLAALGDGQRWREALATRAWSMWRYGELLPLRRPRERASLGETVTPLLDLPRTGQRLGLTRLVVKDEGLLPTGSFKARGAAVGVSRARELGVRHVALPTAGNAGGAWAAYAARAGLRATVVMPEDAPAINVREAQVTGADVRLVRGLISDAGAIVGRAVARGSDGPEPVFEAATLKEPYRVEGKKTMGFELAEQYAWDLPDAILYPCGGGVGLIGMWKAFSELQAIGLINARRPRLIAVQAEGCAPIVRAWEQGAEASTFWQGAQTVASGIRVPKALGDGLVLRACRETHGCAVAVSDAQIVAAIHRVAADDGLFLSPEGAATVAALPELRERGLINSDERIVVFNTGAGLKYPELVNDAALVIDPDDDL
jgi:threonine synthase